MRSVLPRLQLVELMDLPWFPGWLRRYQTDLLVFAWRGLAPRGAIAGQLTELLASSESSTLVDLCSGSGGPAISLVRALRKRSGQPLELVLTDLYPNPDLPLGEGASYWPEPVDARAIDPALVGVRTLFGSFHHFAPEQAREILADARRRGQPIAVYEVTSRTARCLFLIILHLFGPLVFTPFVRPFSWRRLLFTYAVPLVSLSLIVDGVVSVFRTYTPLEMLELARGDGDAPYDWRSGTLGWSVLPIVYLNGQPRGE
jgi:hypothetical protein